MIGKVIAYMRKTAGYSQQELAKKVGIASSTLSGYETGNSQPNFTVAEKTANACKFDLVFMDRNNRESFIAAQST